MWTLQREDGAKIIQGITLYAQLNTADLRRLNELVPASACVRLYLSVYGDIMAHVIDRNQRSTYVVIRYRDLSEPSREKVETI